MVDLRNAMTEGGQAMTALTRLSIRRPGWTLSVGAIVVLAAVPGILHLELRTDGRTLVPATAPQVLCDQMVRDQFGVRDPLVVLIEGDHPNGIFNPTTLLWVRDLTSDFLRIDNVRAADVVSLATEHGFRFRQGTLQNRPLLEELPETPEELEQLRDDLRRIELYDGTLVGRDGRSTAILIGTPEDHRQVFYRQVRELASKNVPSGHSIEVIGAPVAEALLGNHILADLGVPPSMLGAYGDDGDRKGLPMVPVAITLMALVFLASFRRLAAALLPLVEVGCCLVMVFGVMGWLGVPIYLTTAILPVVLIAVGVADEIHIFRRYWELHRKKPDTDPATHVRVALEELSSPVIRTSLTTALGFLSFALSPLAPVRILGLFAAFGAMVSMLWSLSVIPALLIVLPPDWWVRRPRHGSTGDFWQSLCSTLARVALRRRWAVLLAVMLMMGVSLEGIRRVTVQDSWIESFEPESAFAQTTRRFEEQFFGSHTLLVVVRLGIKRHAGQIEAAALDRPQLVFEAPPDLVPEDLEGGWLRISRPPQARSDDAVMSDDQRWRRAHWYWPSLIESAQHEKAQLVVTTPQGDGTPSSWLRPQADELFDWEVRSQPLMRIAILERLEKLESFLGELPGVGGVLGPARYLATTSFMLEPEREESRRIPDKPHMARRVWSSYSVVRGEERLQQLITPDYSQALVTVYLKGSNYLETRQLMTAIRSWEQVHLAPHGIALGFAGDVAVSQALIDAVVTTQVVSLCLALLGILAVTTLLSRSFSWGILCIVPAAVAVLLDFAVLGWSSMPLGVATSMFAAMTLGVGIDFSIHLMARFGRAQALGLRGATALADALTATGPAILIDALAVGLGFATLMLSHVPANARLGVLLTTSVFGCVVTTLLILPALLAYRPLPVESSNRLTTDSALADSRLSPALTKSC